MQSKAGTSQLNLQHGTNNWKEEKHKKKLKSKNRICSEIYRQTVWRIREVSHEEEKEAYGGKDLQKRKVLSLDWKSEEWSNTNSNKYKC